MMQEDYKYGPSTGIGQFLLLMNEILPKEHHEVFLEWLSTPGKGIEFAPPGHPNFNNMDCIVHGSFPLTEVNLPESAKDYIPLPESGTGYMVEHVSTGFFFVIYRENEKFEYLDVLDFDGTCCFPENVLIALPFEIDLWEPTEPVATGNRIGGIPLNSDGSPYTGPWPHTKDNTMSFIGQYQLDDGRYIRIFFDDTDDFDYSANMPDDEGDETDPYTLAFLEGEPFPAKYAFPDNNAKAISSPDKAGKMITPSFVKHFPPIWIQGDGTPNDPDYEFLWHFGFSSRYKGNVIVDEFGDSEFYLFMNKKTGRIKVIMQC